MKFSKVFFFFFAFVMAMSTTSARPENFFKELERAGQRVRDAIINAKPAIDVISDTQKVWKDFQT
ncbi:unnamed protein product [Diatraea saccharalis]|uniref:Uncharacterized protein n=1 Tax=Diatraea saccharalis TaxID=40085 RepID=A0A9N9WKU3_9NEOP|nr:unnamed protein product [Diatraea saccharalis]CAH0763475.1 unnamed protein product [Diatraea saccharalis]CAH0763477.1 unnamed protein product [Diatraea saccharalis]